MHLLSSTRLQTYLTDMTYAHIVWYYMQLFFYQLVTNLGNCGRAVSASLYNQAIQAPVTGSWDRTVRIWDPRSATSTTGDNGGAVSVHKQPDTVYTMDSVNHLLVVGTAGRHVLIWDLRQMGAPVEQQESNLRYQTRCIRCFPNGQGYVLSSIEG